MKASVHSERGFTLFEVVVAAALAGMVLLAATQLFATTDALVSDSKLRIGAEAKNRQGIQSIASVLRAVDLVGLGGFDEANVATVPSFHRVTGAAGTTLDFGPAESIEWRANPLASASDVPNRGDVYLKAPGGDVLLAQDVPHRGFRVEQDGRNLVIHLTTYALDSSNNVVDVSRRAVVSVRNAE